MSKKIYSGRYEVQAFIADGELGTIYKASDATSFDRIVALKVIHSHLSDDVGFLSRFREETRKTTRLQTHPNIVNLLDVEHDHGTDYLVMEYFPSTNLRDHLRTLGKFRVPNATRVILQIAEALLHTHSSDVLHRHIKPANILLNNTQHAKLTDFGLATAMSEPSLIPSDSLIGTLMSMSPEQARQVGLNGQTDLFSLGLVFYELITGEHLWKNIPASTIYDNLANKKTIPSIHFPTEIPQTVQEVIKNLLRFDPEDRIQDAQTLVARLKHLESILSDHPSGEDEEDPDATILISRKNVPEQIEDDTTEVIQHPPTLHPSTQKPSVSSSTSVKKQPPERQDLDKNAFEDDPAAKAKDPAKPYYFVDDSHSFNKHREEIAAKKPLFSDQFPTPSPQSSPSFFTVKKMVAFAFIVLAGATLFWNQRFFSSSPPSQQKIVLQETDNKVIQEKNEQDFVEFQATKLNEQTQSIVNTVATEIEQQPSAALDVQSADLTQQTKATADAQITNRAQQTTGTTKVQTEELAQQAKIAIDAQVGERARQAKVATDAQAAELARQAQATADTQAAERVQKTKAAAAKAMELDKQDQATQNTQVTADAQAGKLPQQAQATEAALAAKAQAEELYQQAKAATEARTAELARQTQATADARAIEHARKAQAEKATKAETQALMNVLEQLRGSVAKKDLSALTRMSTMSESRYRMLTDLFSRYRTVEISLGDVIRTPAMATATLQITKLIRPNGVIVQPHRIVQDIKVTVQKNEEHWNLPTW